MAAFLVSTTMVLPAALSNRASLMSGANTSSSRRICSRSTALS